MANEKVIYTYTRQAWGVQGLSLSFLKSQEGSYYNKPATEINVNSYAAR